MTERRTILVSTIHPTSGGVPAMLRFVIDCLVQRNYQITLAYYRPYSTYPDLSVPLQKLFSRRPSEIDEQFYGVDCIGLGCWLPELEITHYWNRKAWEELIRTHDDYMTVSGSCLAAFPFVQTATPFFGWIASDWEGDRCHRVKKFPWYRRLVDQIIVTPLAKVIEKKIVRSNQLIALSEHTRDELNDNANTSVVEHVLNMPVDTDFFIPKVNQQLNYKIGFVGRFEDPRKNLDLLLHSFARILKVIPNVELVLVGDTISENTKTTLQQLTIQNNVMVMPYLEKQALPEMLQSLDMFILPSHQEGLCIAALEAMSCGIPVVSTRCGGPESYIANGINGVLCDHTVEAISSHILKLYSDEKLRISYAINARKTVLKSFSLETQKNKFWKLFDLKFKNNELL